MGEEMKNIVSLFMVTLIIVSAFALAFNIQPVKASGTIYASTSDLKSLRTAAHRHTNNDNTL